MVFFGFGFGFGFGGRGAMAFLYPLFFVPLFFDPLFFGILLTPLQKKSPSGMERLKAPVVV